MALHDDIVRDLNAALKTAEASRKRHSRFDADLEKGSELEAAIADGQLTIWQVDPKGNRSEIVHIPVAEALHTLSPTEYARLLQAWKKRSSKLASLFNPNAREFGVMRSLADLLARDSIIPFVGAGLSVESGRPLWGDYLRSLAQDCSAAARIKVEEEIAKFAYEEAAQSIADDRADLLTRRLANDFREYDPAQVSGAVTMLPELFPRAAITTNFDNILEVSYRKLSRGFERTAYGTTHNEVIRDLLGSESCLWKLHGDHREKATHVFTRSQYDSAYGSTGTPDYNQKLPCFLRQIYVSRNLLFLGCRLVEDRTLKLFADVKTQGFSLPQHFAFLEAPKDDAERSARTDSLEKLGISALWYPHGRHELVREFVELLVALKTKETKLV